MHINQSGYEVAPCCAVVSVTSRLKLGLDVVGSNHCSCYLVGPSLVDILASLVFFSHVADAG